VKVSFSFAIRALLVALIALALFAPGGAFARAGTASLSAAAPHG
jgi:hypothetical protein